jgi:hypothetical protein
MSKAIANLTQLAETITFSGQDNGESINVTLNELAKGADGPAGVGVPIGGTEGQILVKTSATDYDTEWVDNFAETLTIRATNKTNTTLNKGAVVRIDGAQGQRPTIALAQADTGAGADGVIGILLETLANNASGLVCVAGLAKRLNTDDFEEGDKVFLSPTVPGGLTTTRPLAPYHSVAIGVVSHSSQTTGTIEVNVVVGTHLEWLHDVAVQGVTGGEVLRYNAGTSLWEDVSATEYTVANTVVARDSTGSTAIKDLYVGDFTGGSPSGDWGIISSSGSETGITIDGTPSLILRSTAVETQGQLKVAGGTLTTSKPVDITQTWNSAGVTFTGLRFNAEGSSATNSAAASLLMDLQVGGVSRFKVDKFGNITVANSASVNGTQIFNDALHIPSATGRITIGSETVQITRDASGQLAQRNGTNAQTFRVYGTYTDASNFERLNIGYRSAATAYQIGTEKGSGGGTARALELQTDATTRMYVHPTNGRVGIGTSAPDQLLHVNGTIKAYSNVQLAANAVIQSVSTSGAQGLTLIGSAGTPNSYVEIRGTSANSTTDYIKLTGGNNGANEIARFLGSGNAGIGTSSPASRLTVTGGDAEVTDSARGLILKSPNGTRYRINVNDAGALTTTLI